VNPRLAGTLDALKDDETSANRRGTTPFEGPDRLAYWRAKRDVERNVGRARGSLGQDRAPRGPGHPMHAFAAGIPLGIPARQASHRPHDLPNALRLPMRGAVVPSNEKMPG